MKIIALITAIFLGGNVWIAAAEPIPASDVNWLGLSGFIGTNFAQGKPILCLLAPGTPRPNDHEAAIIIGLAGPMDEAMTKWFRDHPKAVVVTIAHIDTSGTKAAAMNNNYVWVVEGDHNLNLELVRQGFIAPNTQTGVSPQDLKIPRADYDAFVQKAWQAGKEAREKKAGMWMNELQNFPKSWPDGATRVIAAEPTKSKLQEPKLSIEDALSIARDYVLQHHILVSDSYIDSTRLDLNPRGDRGKFWLVTWLRNEYANGVPIKGGQFFMRIYMDRTVEVFYGD